ncbi:Fructosamine kinase-domain-containing protein [Phialemonium atrogriseum]|uniref:protein-ribulosamine 3-kinase n=1 Tax=Phialemonium atrogriseum TaxID=1093897 RepID=A0AAJ0FI39_9PEZI|nr:Fructosamine kinase-domain-containing protein [Phialemonium atrogriseum]KAK1761730.1 Fructosamine kinase-domain-containing protein [Phialemonium atrogriseum]
MSDSPEPGDQQYEIDPNILAALPEVAEVLEATHHGESAWAKAMRIKVRHTDGSEECYFMKVSTGYHGREALKGEFASTSAIYSITPDFCPKPLAWGTFQDDPESHFYLCKFYDFTEGLPEPISFCKKLARLHSSHTSPEGKFGFHCTTYNGDLPQDNTWVDTWEAFFSNGLRHVLRVREERAGPSQKLDALLPPLFDKVIPRLLRPLESGGRKIEPSLVHGDLWCGNAGIIDESSEEGIVYDPASFWAHNEYELGNWRPVRNKFTQRYFEAYHSHIPKAEPEEDYDDRNALYSLRFNLHAAALFPGTESFLDMAIEEIWRLTERYPEGYTEEADVVVQEKGVELVGPRIETGRADPSSFLKRALGTYPGT